MIQHMVFDRFLKIITDGFQCADDILHIRTGIPGPFRQACSVLPVMGKAVRRIIHIPAAVDTTQVGIRVCRNAHGKPFKIRSFCWKNILRSHEIVFTHLIGIEQ